MKHKHISLALICTLLLLFFASCAKQPPAPQPTEPPPEGSGTLTISFDFEKQSGPASNQFAVWIEDKKGNLIKTLCATEFTAKGGWRRRPDSLAIWVGKALDASDFDAVATATPRKNMKPQSFQWDLTDEAGKAVPKGTYLFFVEGTLKWKNYVLYSGEIKIDGAGAIVEATPAFFFAGEGRQPALDENAAECGMITNVLAEYIP